jgi:hypothetical protein
MFRLPIRNLLSGSLLMLVMGCSVSPYPYLQKQEHFSSCFNTLRPAFSKILYNAQVNVTGKHLSGLLLFKTMTDSSVQVVFTNEMGVTFFHFEYGKSKFRVVSIIEKMNKKVVINRLRDDIGLLLQYGFQKTPPEIYSYQGGWYYRFIKGKEQVFYITDQQCSTVTGIETASSKRKKIVVNMHPGSSGMPDSVYLAHQFFEYNITLKQIPQ